MKKQYLITAIVAILVGAGGFFGGMTFQKKQDSLSGLSGTELIEKMKSLGGAQTGFAGNRDTTNGTMGAPDGNFPGGDFPGGSTNGNRGMGGGFINGEVISVDGQSVTIKQQDGNTKTVYFSSSTTISKTVTGTATDLVVGTDVSANGTSNSDGSVTATNIQIRTSS
jgi:hypothetical protein